MTQGFRVSLWQDRPNPKDCMHNVSDEVLDFILGKEDCIILDFVDLSDLSLVNLPSLLGLPREINLEGESSEEAVDLYIQIKFDFPGFEIELINHSVRSKKKRAQSFDPLTVDTS